MLDLPLQRLDSAVALNMLHGGGSEVNSCNRWFDKTCQFIVSRDGACGLTYEHSPAEGPPVIALVDHAFNHMQQRRQTAIAAPTASGLPPPQELPFVIDPETKRDFEVAKSNMWRWAWIRKRKRRWRSKKRKNNLLLSKVQCERRPGLDTRKTGRGQSLRTFYAD